ncbi:hypothetical protein [Methylocucumis oryzae]|uniref:hypothetical protein n=1 Tax=Methylocucumis oryzae TaxID=1632867 RepID=UPI00178CAA1A|nr:hypothetical protein [Methylocucumis oryzae]
MKTLLLSTVGFMGLTALTAMPMAYAESSRPEIKNTSGIALKPASGAKQGFFLRSVCQSATRRR